MRILNITAQKPYNTGSGIYLAELVRVFRKKGIFSLLRALKNLTLPAEKLELTLAGGVGSEDEYNSIVQLAETVPYPVQFTGKLDQQQIADTYRNADVSLLTWDSIADEVIRKEHKREVKLSHKK